MGANFSPLLLHPHFCLENAFLRARTQKHMMSTSLSYAPPFIRSYESYSLFDKANKTINVFTNTGPEHAGT